MKKVLFFSLLLFLKCGGGKNEGKDITNTEKGEIFSDVECLTHKNCQWGKGCNGNSCGEPSDKGLGIAPLFSLPQLNPKSPTYEKNVKLEDYKGKVVFLHFVLASCGYCQYQVKYFRNIFGFLEKNGYKDIAFFLINIAGAEEVVEEMTKLTILPVLQDNYDENVFGKYGAKKDNVFIIDKLGYIREKYEDPKMPAMKDELTKRIIEIYEMSFF